MTENGKTCARPTPTGSGREFADEVIKQVDAEDTPVYVVDVEDICRKVELWRELFPRVTPYYAVRCNDHISVLETLCRLGLSFGCCTAMEMSKILSLKEINPSRIMCVNPCNLVADLKHASSNKIDLVTYDSEDELKKISTHYPGARLVTMVRVSDEGSSYRMARKYGVPLEDLEAMLKLAKEFGLTVVGLSFHTGRINPNPQVFAGAIEIARKAVDIARAVGHSIELLNIAGDVPGYRGADNEARKFASVINESLSRHFSQEGGIHIVSEMGDFFTRSAYTLFVKVVGKRIVKESENDEGTTMYYINESAFKSFEVTLFDQSVLSFKPLKEHTGPLMESIIWGTTCDGFDKIHNGILLPDLQVGEWLKCENMGAYTTATWSMFNGFPDPVIKVMKSFQKMSSRQSSVNDCERGSGETEDQAANYGLC